MLILIGALISLVVLTYCIRKEKIGVIYIVHGGQDTNNPQYMWNASVQMFSYDPNHPVYKAVIWNSANWSMVLQSEFAVKFLRKYEFEYERIGGEDPFTILTIQQMDDMKTELDKKGCIYGLEFEVDWAGWMCGEDRKSVV